MRSMVEACKILDIQVTEDQLTAGRYLEAHGKSFCVEFGYENAVAKADELFDLECELALAFGCVQ